MNVLKKELVVQVEDLKAELSCQLEINSQLTADVTDLKAELTDAEFTITDFNDELDEKQRRITLLTDQVKMLDKSITRLTKGNIVKGTFINELGTLVTKLTESMTESEDDAFQNVQAINRLIK